MVQCDGARWTPRNAAKPRCKRIRGFAQASLRLLEHLQLVGSDGKAEHQPSLTTLLPRFGLGEQPPPPTMAQLNRLPDTDDTHGDHRTLLPRAVALQNWTRCAPVLEAKLPVYATPAWQLYRLHSTTLPPDAVIGTLFACKEMGRLDILRWFRGRNHHGAAADRDRATGPVGDRVLSDN